MLGIHPTINQHPTIAEIRINRLADNFQKLQEHFAPAEVMAVVKANAYGHGLVEASQVCCEAGANWLAVASVAEGLQLRVAGIVKPILVFGGILPDYLEAAINANLDLTVSSCSKLKEVVEKGKALGKRPRVHLKIDTGMERIGVHYYSCEELLHSARLESGVEIVGIYSHVAQQSTQEEQLSRLNNAVAGYEIEGGKPKIHLAASNAAFTCPEARLDIVRPGIALYGCYEFANKELGLLPVMRLVSKVVYFKVTKKGAGVSYAHRWSASEQTRIATVAIGYGDGAFPRMFLGREVLIRGVRYPVVGTVCMDQLMVDLGPDGEAYNGDEVVIIGDDITAEQIAEVQGTVAHEIVTAISARVPRVYIDG